LESQIVKELKKEFNNLELFDFPRSGKNKVLNKMVSYVKTDIMYFMDADVKIKNNTIKQLNVYLSDPNVGAAISALNIVTDDNENAGAHGETIYQKYESNIRVQESLIDSNVNSLGAFYGVKKDSFKYFPSDKVCDDLYNVFSVISNKKRVIFDDKIIVDEVREKSIGQEFNRKVRVVSGGLSTIESSAELLGFSYGWSSFFVWSHKMVRWFSPVFLILLIVLTFPIPLNSNIKDALLILQLIGYGSALIGYLLDRINVSIGFFKLSYFYLSMNAAFFMGILRYLSGKQNAAWDRQGLAD
jgi:cellulose synthase/poly-beta-1,6-N-acetylglucosamine synthase-like glycosyltransferase